MLPRILLFAFISIITFELVNFQSLKLLYSNSFVYFCCRIDYVQSKTFWKNKKRYAYLELENLRNFHSYSTIWHDGFPRIAWAAVSHI